MNTPNVVKVFMWRDCLYGHTIEEARGVLSSLQSWKVYLNGAAPCLAKEVLCLTMEQGIIEEVPGPLYFRLYICRAVCLI
jgi:hypothetical protein